MRTLTFVLGLAFAPLAAQEITPKIIGGKDAVPGEYPWMAGLLQSDQPDNYLAQYCGGVLIHPYYVLTAAHCVQGMSRLDIEVLVGTDDLDVGGRRLDVAEITIHPLFHEVSFDYDLALVRLSTPVTDIEPIGIADVEAWQVAGKTARVLGWGAITNDDVFPNDLQEADITIQPFDQANADWGFTLSGRMLPATSPGGLRDTCEGDSGGPLLVRRPVDGAWVVAGITSFGAGCGEDDPPGVYTRVFSLRDYIYQRIYPDMHSYLLQNDQFALLEDTDGDGLPLFVEFGYHGNPDVGDLTRLPRAGQTLRNGETHATLTFQRRRNVRSFEYILEQAATPMGPWERLSLNASITVRHVVDLNTERLTVRAAAPIDERPYLRLRYEPTGSL